MEDFASMDTGVLDAEFTDIAPSTEVATTETAVPDATGDATTAETTALTVTGDARLTTGPGKLSEAASTALATIKATHPAVASQLTRAIHVMDAVRAEFPGGLKEARELKARVAEFETEGPFEKTRQELAGFREYDRQFMAGDPKFVETMIAAEPGAFQKLAPMMMAKFAELNPDGYKSLVSAASIKDMTDSGVVMNLNLMQYALDDLSARLQTELPGAVALQNRVIDLFNSFVGFINKTGEQAKKQVAAPASVTDDRSKNLETRENDLRRQEWSVDTKTSLAKTFKTEFDRLAVGRRFSTEAREDLIERFSMRLQKALENTEGFNTKLDSYIRSGDRQAHLRYLNSLYAQHVPRILTALIKPAAQPAVVTKTTVAQPAQTAAATGFTRVAAQPVANTIDWQQTSVKMVEQNKAILKTGQMVQWS